MRKIFLLISILTLILMCRQPIICFGQSATSAQSSAALKSPMMQAREFMSKNKNAEALEVLQKYGSTLTTKYTREQDSIVKSISGKFAVQKSKMVKEIEEKEAKVKELQSGNADIDKENTVLTTNTIIFFSVLTGIVVFVLLGRMRVLTKSREKLNYSNSLLAEMGKEAATIPILHKSLIDVQKPLSEANSRLSNMAPFLAALTSDKAHPYHKQAKHLLANTDAIIQMSESRINPAEDLKVQTDLNRIIEEVVSQAYFSMMSRYPEFKCTVVKDLEKILPTLEVYPEDIRFVLFNLLENAFDAVWKKRSNSPKGYEPTVTISTRKLPRFVQIRVKDNGVGIPEKSEKKIFEPFYSERDSNRHPGLGLSESHRIITQKHKGELYIDADLASSTDFIIRFPTLQLM